MLILVLGALGELERLHGLAHVQIGTLKQNKRFAALVILCKRTGDLAQQLRAVVKALGLQQTRHIGLTFDQVQADHS